MLPQDQVEHSRYGTHPEGDPHLSLPGIRDIFGLEATDDLGTLVSQPHYSGSPKPGPLRLNPPSAAHSAPRSHLLVTEVSPPESPASSRMSMSTHDYQPSRYEVASGGHSPHSLLLSPASQPPNWANYDAQTLASSLPSVHSLPPLSSALAPQGGRGRSLSEAANTRHVSYSHRRGQQHDRHPSLAVLPQGARSGLGSSFATTAGPADHEAPHRRMAMGDRRPVNAPPFSTGVSHAPAPLGHYSPTQAPFYEPGRAMSPMPVAHPGGLAYRQLHAGAGSRSGQRPETHDRQTSRSNESANSPLYHRQEPLVHGTPPHPLSHTPSPRLYGRPVGRAHHLSQGTPSPSLQGHHSVTYAGTPGRLRSSRSSSSLKGTHSSEETATEDKSAGRYECEYCSKRFNRPSSLKIHVNKHTGAQPFQCPFPDCGRRFSVMSNMRRHARVHTNALVDTPTDGEGAHQQAGAGSADTCSSSQSQETSVSRGSSGRRAGLALVRGGGGMSSSSRGRSSSFSGSGPGSPIDMEMEMAEGGREREAAFSPRPGSGRSARSQPIGHIPGYGNMCIIGPFTRQLLA